MRKILVVEDEDAIREVVALNLRLAGYEVTEAASAVGGLRRGRAGHHAARNERFFPV